MKLILIKLKPATMPGDGHSLRSCPTRHSEGANPRLAAGMAGFSHSFLTKLYKPANILPSYEKSCE